VARIGLVLGAGGVVGGAFHAGVLAAVAEATDWDPGDAEVVVGTSAGATTGAMLRAGTPTGALLGRPVGSNGPTSVPERVRLRALRPRVTAPAILARTALRPWEARVGLLAAALLPPGVVPTRIISEAMAPHFPVGWPERTLWIVAVHLSSGRRVVFGRPDAPMA
jgi:NTE family protein